MYSVCWLLSLSTLWAERKVTFIRILTVILVIMVI